MIGIVGKPENTTKRLNYILVNNEIRKCIVNNGGLPIGILPMDDNFKLKGEGNKYELTSEDISNLKEVISRVDGIILQGGLVSNAYEEEIVKICLSTNKPILGICSGFNNMVRAIGGSLYEKKNNIHNKYDENYVHNVIINKSSYLYKILKKDIIPVNSIHIRVTDMNSIKNCRATAICSIDNTVEAIEIEEQKFAIGIKWHPELMPEMNNIFKEFVEVLK